MLLLDRKVGQKIIIDGTIVLVVLGFDRGRVKIGLDAPKEVTISKEKYKRHATNQQADSKESGICTEPSEPISP